MAYIKTIICKSSIVSVFDSYQAQNWKTSIDVMSSGRKDGRIYFHPPGPGKITKARLHSSVPTRIGLYKYLLSHFKPYCQVEKIAPLDILQGIFGYN
jgi:hypothetical protein